ncbi:MAG TPA: GNAT family N-acetyltransferase [Allosphingosinicella sp.]
MADARDEMLREMARNRGCKLVKSRRRKPGGDFGLYGLVDPESGREVFGFGDAGLTASGEEIEAWLRKGLVSTWKSSIEVVEEVAASAAAPDPARTPEKKKEAPAKRAATSGPKIAAPAPSPPAPEAEAPVPPRRRVAAPREEVQRAPVPTPAPPPEPRLSVRDARAKDAGAIAALVREMGVEASETEIAARLGLLLKGNQAPLVAERDGEVAGCLTWSVTPALHRAQPFGRITMIIVARDLRRRGVGKALLEEGAARMAERGCTLVEAISEIGLDAAHDFFRRLGFERTSYRFARELKR